MFERLSRLLTRAMPFLAAAVLFASAAYWGGRFFDARVRSEVRAEASSLAIPVAGLKVRFDVGLTSLPHSLGASTLLLVSSDDCPMTPAALPAWEEIIASMRGGQGSIRVITRGQRLADTIRQLGLSYDVPVEVLEKDGSTTWARASGLSATPSTIALGADGRIAVVGTSLDESDVGAFRRYFSPAADDERHEGQ